MGWIRTRARWGTWCALLALALQFALSFGHAHALASPFGASPLFGLSDHAHPADAPDAPAAPVKPAGLAFDYCAICAVANLAANAVPASAPGLAIPAAFHPIRIWPDAAAATAASPHRLFRARAPPLA
jgi:hypothetical protein